MALPSLTSSKYELTVPSTNTRVEYRPYLVKEEKILMIAAESEDESQMIRGIKDIIKSCTFDKMNVDRLTMFDLEYIFTILRSKSVGESSNVSLVCVSCDEPNEVTINLDTVTVTEGVDKNIKLTDTIGMVMKYPYIDDVINAASDTDVEAAFELIVSCIDSIYEGDEMFGAEDQTREELMTFVESLNTQQFEKINKFVLGIPHAFIDAEFNCTKCKTHNEINIRGLANFFK